MTKITYVNGPAQNDILVYEIITIVPLPDEKLMKVQLNAEMQPNNLM
jgi:hypothetical protein